MNVDIHKLHKIIESNDAKKIAHYLENHNLRIKDNKIVSNDSEYVKSQVEYWNRRQLVKKINLNS